LGSTTSINTNNQLWGEYIKKGKTNLILIKYKIDGFEVKINNSQIQKESYDKIDDYRKGVLILSE
jgi:hypothetical protein